MHRLDGHIMDIEPRIKSICENVPKQEEPSLQDSLVSYGWILLDSWVAWRTLRYLLREVFIDDDVNTKWFQTPSSYTASQLRAIWKFNEITEAYIENECGQSLKALIDSTIQKKRNTCAHFSKGMEIHGQDAKLIGDIFSCLSKVFLFYEVQSFLCSLQDKFLKKGFEKIEFSFENEKWNEANQFGEYIAEFSKCNSLELRISKEQRVHKIFLEREGCFAGEGKKLIINEEQTKYDFFGNKGFYRNIDLFVDTTLECFED